MCLSLVFDEVRAGMMMKVVTIKERGGSCRHFYSLVWNLKTTVGNITVELKLYFGLYNLYGLDMGPDPQVSDFTTNLM